MLLQLALRGREQTSVWHHQAWSTVNKVDTTPDCAVNIFEGDTYLKKYIFQNHQIYLYTPLCKYDCKILVNTSDILQKQNCCFSSVWLLEVAWLSFSCEFKVCCGRKRSWHCSKILSSPAHYYVTALYIPWHSSSILHKPYRVECVEKCDTWQQEFHIVTHTTITCQQCFLIWKWNNLLWLQLNCSRDCINKPILESSNKNIKMWNWSWSLRSEHIYFTNGLDAV